MTEETLFAEAIEKSTPAEQAAFLDAACGGDAALRQRVEALLQSHAREGFLKTPAIQRAAEVAGGSPIAGATEAEVHDDDAESALDFLVPSERSDSLGRLGHYEVQEIIGRGGMGVVLRAFDEKLHRVVAIKVIAAQLATNATARKRFTREAQAQAAVSHDHIVTIHAVEADSLLPYLVTQYISGMSLQERLDKSGPMQLHEILRIGMQTASALAAAHAQVLVHRDIKPANILLENGVERVKITDFGLARAATEASLTQSGVVAGTPQYMSPEQAEGKAIDQRTDLFSLGSVLYAMCTGRAPFRASGSMAVLKRVCEQTPTPIRETNAEIPNWLVAIIDKLHAKDPAQRYQSATEVAELLGRHLAQVQHPSVVGQVSNLPQEPRTDRKPALRRSRWAAAAVVLLCLLAGLSLTEATGVTNVRATVIRIFMPDGTLVVEINDPAVKVTVEGDGGLVITGAGLEEIRLRPGSYRVHADRDGKPLPLDKDLVTVARGGRAIVKVKLEAAGAAPAKAEGGAFVVLTGKGVAERKFDALAEAVQGANDGDTIEIRGNGPFVSPTINPKGQALTIRAGHGFRPVIKLNSEGIRESGFPFATAPLTLEGLEIQEIGPKDSWGGICVSGRAPQYVANCRFHLRESNAMLGNSSVCMRNCELLGRGAYFGVSIDNDDNKTRFDMENCVGRLGFYFSHVHPSNEFSIRLKRNTVLIDNETWLYDLSAAHLPMGASDKASKPVEVDASENIFDAPVMIQFRQTEHLLKNSKALSAAEAAALLMRLVTWRERRNLYPDGKAGVTWTTPNVVDAQHGPKMIADWNRFWRLNNADSLEGQVRYEGGNLRAKMAEAPEKLSPQDFRLRPDSAGYKAGKDKKDLGADVDLVGPGPAYERWKKTPQYQQWLKDTKQAAKAEPAKPEPKPPVLLTDDAVKKELARWQGEWENAGLGRLIIKGDRWSWHPKDAPEVVSTIKIVEITDKMTHVLLLNTGLDAKVRSIQVILRVDGNTLHNCGTPGSIRPTAFANQPGYLYAQWKRVTKTPP